HDFQIEVVDQGQGDAAGRFRVEPGQGHAELGAGADIGDRVFLDLAGLQAGRLGAFEYAQAAAVVPAREGGLEPQVAVQPGAAPTGIRIRPGGCAERVGTVEEHRLHDHAARIVGVGGRLRAARVETIGEKLA